MAISRRRPPPSVVIRHAERPWAQARRPLGWLVCSLNAPSSLPGAEPEARNTSISRYPLPERGVCHRRPCVHRSLTRPAN